MDIFFTADTHFFHKYVILPTYSNRPFSSVEEMNEVIVERWNEVVKPKDRVYHLGDFAFFYGKSARVEKLYNRLNGNIFLCIGSHDKEITKLAKNNFLTKGAISQFYQMTIADSFFIKQHVPMRIFCSHYMHYTWRQSHYGAWHLHAHSHGGLTKRVRSQRHGKVIDVGVDGHDFRPWNIDEVSAEMAKLDNNFNLVDKGWGDRG